MSPCVRRAAVALFLLALLALAGGASAKDLRPYDAPRIEAEHISVPAIPLEYLTHEDAGITLSYSPSAGERVRPLEGRLSAIRAELSAEIGRDVLAQVEIRIAAIPGQMARIAPVEQLPGYANAVAFSQAHLVVMSAASPLSLDPPNLEVVLRHALAHLALDEALGGQPVPRWFHEGYAVHFAGEEAAHRAELLSVAALRREILDLHALEAHFPAEPPQRSVAYAEAADFLRFLSAPASRERFAEALAKIRAGEPCPEGGACRSAFESALTGAPAFEGALTDAYGESLAGIERSWRKQVALRYGFVPVFAGSMLAWALVAAAVMVHRLRRRRAMAVPLRSRSLSPSRRAAVASYLGRRGVVDEGVSLGRLGSTAYGGSSAMSTEGSARRARASVLSVDSEMEDGAPPDIEVPKVEHDGRWYTLH